MEEVVIHSSMQLLSSK